LIDLVIFDLDGTLIDSKLDLAHAVNAMRAHLSMPPLDGEVIFSYVGNGAPVLVRRAIGPEPDDAQHAAALAFFLQYYREHMLDNTVLYPEVKETLQALTAKGVKMAILTNKPVRISEAILDGLGVSRHFCRIFGGNSFEQKKPDPIGIFALLQETSSDPSHALMVGDSAVDIRTARNAGIQSCGVTYGFQPETLNDPKPDFLIDRIGDLPAVVLGIIS
jgi:phosphoglycolate phosphatase